MITDPKNLGRVHPKSAAKLSNPVGLLLGKGVKPSTLPGPPCLFCGSSRAVIYSWDPAKTQLVRVTNVNDQGVILVDTVPTDLAPLHCLDCKVTVYSYK